MNRSIIFWVLGALIIVGWKSCYHPAFPETVKYSLSPYFSEDLGYAQAVPKPCDGRNYCVYIYMAPWCPACQQTVSHIAEYRRSWKSDERPGLMVILGSDKKEALNTMAQTIGTPVFLDLNGKFSRALHVRSIPAYIVVDRKQRIIASGEAGRQWVANEIKKHGNHN